MCIIILLLNLYMYIPFIEEIAKPSQRADKSFRFYFGEEIKSELIYVTFERCKQFTTYIIGKLHPNGGSTSDKVRLEMQSVKFWTNSNFV